MNFILRYIKTESIWKELMRREKLFDITNGGRQPFTEAFSKVPPLAQWMRFRELVLLKSSFQEGKSKDFIMGQIAENKLYQSFDIPTKETEKVEQRKEEKKVIDRESFLKVWNK